MDVEINTTGLNKIGWRSRITLNKGIKEVIAK